MKHFYFCIILSSLFSCTLKKSSCERFFSYESKTVNISGLKLALKKNKKSNEMDFGNFKKVSVPVEISDRLKELDFMQYIFCQKIGELGKDDPNKSRLQKEVITIYIEIVRLTFNNKNQDLTQMSEYEFQKLRGRRDGYAIGFIIGRLGRYYKSHLAFPGTLNEFELDIKDKIEAIGSSKISYSLTSDGFNFIFAGQDGVFNTPDDKIHTEKDITN